MNRMTADGTFLLTIYLCEIDIVKAKIQTLLKKIIFQVNTLKYFQHLVTSIISIPGYHYKHTPKFIELFQFYSF